MAKILLFFLCITSFLRAEWDQLFSEGEDPALFHHVNVITGNLNLCLEDGVVEGAKTLPIFRTYSSAGALEPPEMNQLLKKVREGWVVQGGWNFLPHCNLLIDAMPKFKDFKIYLPEPSGNLVAYSYSHRRGDNVFIYKPEKGYGQCSGALGAKGNIGNNILELDVKKGEAVLHLPNGGSRFYTGPGFHHWRIEDFRKMQKKTKSKCFYQLRSETLPSKHEIIYFYDAKNRLVHADLKNPDKTKTFAWMHLDVNHKKSSFVTGVRTSDGKSIQYNTTEFKDVDYICGAQGNCRAQEGSAYVKGRKGIGARISRMDIGGRVQFEATYYTPPNKEKEEKWAYDPAKKHFEIDKVKSLEAPIGPNGENIVFARFTYHPGLTEVRDAGNRLTRYHHSAGNITSVEYCNEQGGVVSILKFIWEGDRLKAKALLDGGSQAHFSKTFQYDAAGNVTHETLWGSLTGSTPGPFGLNGDGSLSNAEHYYKRYEYLPGFNIPTLEEEESGLTYRYQYVPGTDLMTAKFTCKGSQILLREFFLYTGDHLLMVEIADDGSSGDSNSMQSVTRRLIKRYDLDPGSGLARAMLESCYDMASQTENLLRIIHYSYSQNKVVAEAVHDADGAHRYTVYTDYDAQGRVIRKTTPLGQDNIYSYNSFGNLHSVKEVSSPKKIFAYDGAGRPASIEEVDHQGTIKKTFTRYDAQGNLLAQTDQRGNTTEQFYDAFGRCIRTHFPAALDEEGTPYTPIVTFGYDIQGNLISSSILEGASTHTTYNTFRDPVQIVQADGTTIRHTYTKNGTILQTVYSDGTRIDYLHDMFERMVSKRVYSVEGELLSEEAWNYNVFNLLSYTDPNGLTTHYTYDRVGRKISETAESRVISYSYDPLGFLEKTTEMDICHTQIHDVSGRIIEEWKEFPDGRIENHMQFAYNDENRKEIAVRKTSQGEATDRFFYDREFRLVHYINPNHSSTFIVYTEADVNDLGQHVLKKSTFDPLMNETCEINDAQGRIVRRFQKDPNGNIVSQEDLFYDKSGNQARRVSTIYQQNIPKSRITVRWKYDAMGRVVKESEGDDKTTSFSHDERGRVIKRLMPNGVSIGSIYDGLGRLLEMESSDKTVHYQYFYGTGPEPIEVVDLTCNTTLKREYNSFGQLVQETNARGLVFEWHYDHHGRCIEYILPNHSSIDYSYKNGHLAEVSRRSSRGDFLYTHRYLEFDPNGHIAVEDLIHGVGKVHSKHDILERPSDQTSPWLNQSIHYGPSDLVKNTYSSLYGDKAYAHDPLNQLIQEGEESYAFDSLGNPTGCIVNEYNQILSGPDYKIEYDLNGNPDRRITSDGIISYTYDALNRLTSITQPDSKKTLYFYDPFSRLIAEEREGKRILYLYDKTQEIGTMSQNGALLQLKVIGLGPDSEVGRSVAIEISGEAFAPLHDFQGNIVALISSDKKIAESYEIDAFGREKTNAPPLNPWRFCSKRSTNGLVFFGHRFYDSLLGRWLTPDPSGFADGPNLYAYVLNNPLSRLDLFGLDSDPRLPQEMLSMEIPIYKLIIPSWIPVNVMLPCKAIISGVPVDWFVKTDLWHKLQFTPEEWQKGTVNIVDHFQELIPKEGRSIGLITFQNGVCTSKKDLGKNVEAISRMIPEGTLIIGMHNPTKGVLRDLGRTGKELLKKETSIVKHTRQSIVMLSDLIFRISPELFSLHIAHSEGGLIGRNAIRGMTEDQRGRLKQQLYILALGPAKPIPLEYGRGVTNVYSKQDFVTGIFALKRANDPKYDIRLVRCKSSLSERTGYIADHAYLGGTYQHEQFEYIKELRGKWGFYNGKTH